MLLRPPLLLSLIPAPTPLQRALLEHGSPLLRDAVDQADIQDAWLSSRETEDWDDEFRAVTPFVSTAIDDVAGEMLSAAGLELLLGPWLEPSYGERSWISPLMATWRAAMVSLRSRTVHPPTSNPGASASAGPHALHSHDSGCLSLPAPQPLHLLDSFPKP